MNLNMGLQRSDDNASDSLRQYEGWSRQDNQQRYDGLPTCQTGLQDARMRPGPPGQCYPTATADLWLTTWIRFTDRQNHDGRADGREHQARYRQHHGQSLPVIILRGF